MKIYSETPDPTLDFDPEFAMLAGMANVGAGISATVVCGGQLLTGNLTSASEWAKWIANELTGATEKAGLADALGEAVGSLGLRWVETWSEANSSAEAVFFHLQTANGAIWRGRVSDVSAWTPGATQ